MSSLAQLEAEIIILKIIKRQKNPHDQYIWDGDTFQSSSYHSFSLKPGRVKKYPLPHENSVAIIGVTEQIKNSL